MSKEPITKPSRKAPKWMQAFYSPLVLGFVAFLLILAGAYSYLAAIANASLRCIPCDCRYSIAADDSACRWPAIFAYAAYGAFAIAGVLLWLAWRKHRRRAAF